MVDCHRCGFLWRLSVSCWRHSFHGRFMDHGYCVVPWMLFVGESSLLCLGTLSAVETRWNATSD